MYIKNWLFGLDGNCFVHEKTGGALMKFYAHTVEGKL